MDDERAFCVMVSRVLEAEGFQVLRADNGRIALHVLAEREPDVILLDLEMPDVDGWTFYHEARWAGFERPIVIISGRDAKMAQVQLGAQGALQKPFDIDDLAAIIREVTS